MTLKEAIKSGKPFRRPCHVIRFAIKNPNDGQYLSPEANDRLSWSSVGWKDEIVATLHGIYGRLGGDFLTEDVLADDWEVKND